MSVLFCIFGTSLYFFFFFFSALYDDEDFVVVSYHVNKKVIVETSMDTIRVVGEFVRERSPFSVRILNCFSLNLPMICWTSLIF